MDQGLFIIYAFFNFWMGASIASFLNVVIWRVPRGESIVRPPSHCPKCNALIRWYQNIPIIAWLALRGRCAKCRAPISPRYILIELVGGLLFLAAFWQIFSPYVVAAGRPVAPIPVVAIADLMVTWIWISLMIVGTMIDFDHQLLPDFVTVGGMVLGVLYSGAISVILRSSSIILHSLVGLAFGFGLLWLIRFVGSKAFRREAMGMGDVFLMGAVGALYGPVAVLFTLIASSVLGSVVGVTMIALSRAKLGRFVAIPFGPYICGACLIWMFRGPQLVNWYLRLLRF